MNKSDSQYGQHESFEEPHEGKTVAAERFVLVDKSGVARGYFGIDDGTPTLQIRDKDTGAEIFLGLNQGAVLLKLANGKGSEVVIGVTIEGAMMKTESDVDGHCEVLISAARSCSAIKMERTDESNSKIFVGLTPGFTGVGIERNNVRRNVTEKPGS